MAISESTKFGSIGEDVACMYLAKKGWSVLMRNYRLPIGEIDIIARAPEGILVFVEVKSLEMKNEVEWLMPEDNLTKAKLKKLERICRLFSAKHPEYVREKSGWRIDLVALTKQANNVVVNHYENIVDVES